MRREKRMLERLSKFHHRSLERSDLIATGDVAMRAIIGMNKHNANRECFFPLLIKLLGLKSCVEIGVDKGEFSLVLLREPTLQVLYCVDNWMDDYAQLSSGDVRFQEAKQNLKEACESGRVVLIQKTSAEGAQNIQDGSIDFCYVDGDHTYEGVYIDLRVWLPKIRLGGVMAGHDYGFECANADILNYRRDAFVTLRVKPAVDDFTQRYGFDLRVIGKRSQSWWFIKNREADDPDGSYLIKPPQKSTFDVHAR